MREYHYICGQLLFIHSLENINYFFHDSQLKHEIRHSSHFQDGIYLRISLNSNTEMTFEKIEANEFLISGESENEADLLKISQMVSTIFCEQKLKHRLELYNIDDIEFGYYNHDWKK